LAAAIVAALLFRRSHMFRDLVAVVDYRCEMVFRVSAARPPLGCGRICPGRQDRASCAAAWPVRRLTVEAVLDFAGRARTMRCCRGRVCREPARGGHGTSPGTSRGPGARAGRWVTVDDHRSPRWGRGQADPPAERGRLGPGAPRARETGPRQLRPHPGRVPAGHRSHDDPVIAAGCLQRHIVPASQPEHHLPGGSGLRGVKSVSGYTGSSRKPGCSQILVRVGGERRYTGRCRSAHPAEGMSAPVEGIVATVPRSGHVAG